MTKIFLHQTHQTIGDFDNILGYLTQTVFKPGLHLFPESYLTGYPIQDLVLQRPFIEDYLNMFEKLNTWLMEQKGDWTLLLGGLKYEFDRENLPLKIRNVIFRLNPGKPIEDVYTKQLLPNYDIFEEKKYYWPGNETKVIDVNGKNVGLMICEDMWFTSTHPKDPTEDLKTYITEKKIDLDLVVNLSASPFFIGKEEKRIKRSMEISTYLKSPLAYVNRVGGEDEILFDGGSFVVDGKSTLKQGNRFYRDVLEFDWPTFNGTPSEKNFSGHTHENTWETLFAPIITKNDKGEHRLSPLEEKDFQEILQGLKFGVQEYAQKCGFNKFTVALSGGIDSAVVLTLMRLFLEEGQELDAIYMPGFFSASESYDLSYELCQKLNVKLTTLPIKFLHSSVRNAYLESFGLELEGLADENIQSRLRGSLLYARSNQLGSMVLNTSNKSEIAVGYSTLYGDSVGAISLLGDLYKSEVFWLANFINKNFNDLIPERIISRPPSAELRENQEDSQSLPPYDILDTILEGFLSYRLTVSDLVKMGFERDQVEKVYGLYMKSEYKRNQFCPIIKLKAKSFGFGYRVPITKK